jgi:aminoglycoside phosphotransferase
MDIDIRVIPAPRRRGRLVTGLLAHDTALPQRDLLLDPQRVAAVVQRRLRLARPLELTRCEIVRIKYRVGESLRVRYRIAAGGAVHDLACRVFPAGRSEAAYRRALEDAVEAGPLRPVGWAPELETVFWTFPNDRKLRPAAVSELPTLLGTSVRTLRLVAYAPEKSATLRCDGEGGALAYAKLYADGGAVRPRRVHETLAGTTVRVPRALVCPPRADTLLLAPLPGRPLSDLTGAELVEGYRLLGGAVAGFHQLRPPGGERFRRFDSARMRAAATLIARARPDAATQARKLATRLAGIQDGAEADVCLHGDLHPKNALVDSGRVGLVDLDQTVGGPPSADVASVLAGLRYARIAEGLHRACEIELAEVFLAGYGAVRPLPPPNALRRHTAAALLAERALRAVNRIRPNGLAHLRALLADAASLLDG